MISNSTDDDATGRRSRRAQWVVATLACMWTGSAWSGYVGESFLHVPGMAGGWSAEPYKDWVKFEARDWPNVWRPDSDHSSFCAARRCSPEEQLFLEGQSRFIFRGPIAPSSGAGRLAVALDKRSPAFAGLMSLCNAKQNIPMLTYAESADLARVQGEVGPRPADVPDFFEYKLTDVRLTCPVVPNAPEQAFILDFGGITWLNYHGARRRELEPPRTQLPPRPSTGETRTYIVTRVNSASDNSPDECPRLNEEPGKAEYFALLPKSRVHEAEIELERKGGLPELGADMAYRGPNGLNVCALPGIVPDPGHVAPQSSVARGFDLDGDNGKSSSPTGKHRDFTSSDGRAGIDNQHYLIDGCIPGFKRDGNFTNIRNEFMRKGSISVLIEVSGIDDPRNDDDVAVTVLYSRDRIVNNVSGGAVLPNYTFRISDDPELRSMFVRFKGRIENGVVVTAPIAEMTFRDGGQMAYRIHDARMRLQLLPSGAMQALLGGYQDWRMLMSYWGHARIFETTMRYQCPGMYQAFKRAADGLKDPHTGEYKGISVAYDIDGVPAFLPPQQIDALSAQLPTEE